MAISLILPLLVWVLSFWGVLADTLTRPKAKPKQKTLSPEQDHQLKEFTRCYRDPVYFICTYVKILDGTTGQWIPFTLWTEQADTLRNIRLHQLIIILKARQLGMSWLVLGYALWLMIFKPIATVLIFSKRDDEAVYLLGEERLKGMFRRLPDFLKVDLYPIENNDHIWRLSNGSVTRAFPTTGGDSYTATLAIIDEADLVDFDKMLSAVKPTIDAGGQMIALSRANKDEPESGFKRTYRAAREGKTKWHPVFLPWYVRPERTAQWYQDIKNEIQFRTGALDELWEQYPATDEEALAPRSLSKRITQEWLTQVYVKQEPLDVKKLKGVPAVPGLKVFVAPDPKRRYCIGIDTAEGNTRSDDSAISIFNDLGEEVALAYGKWEPDTTAAYAWQLAKYYRFAALMPERNNHGHALISWLRNHAARAKILFGHDAPRDKNGDPIKPDRKSKRSDTIKYGWLSNKMGKEIMYNEIACACRDSTITIHSSEVRRQLGDIEASTLRAPQGQYDDIADAAALAVVGLPQLPVRNGSGSMPGFGAKGWGIT